MAKIVNIVILLPNNISSIILILKKQQQHLMRKITMLQGSGIKRHSNCGQMMRRLKTDWLKFRRH